MELQQGLTERRKFRRIPYGAWVEDLTKAESIQFYLARDLSMGGLLLIANSPPKIGNKVHLRLIVENESRVMSVDGEVVRYAEVEENKTAFAVRFLNLDSSQQTFLEDLIAEHTKDVPVDQANQPDDSDSI